MNGLLELQQHFHSTESGPCHQNGFNPFGNTTVSEIKSKINKTPQLRWTFQSDADELYNSFCNINLTAPCSAINQDFVWCNFPENHMMALSPLFPQLLWGFSSSELHHSIKSLKMKQITQQTILYTKIWSQTKPLVPAEEETLPPLRYVLRTLALLCKKHLSLRLSTCSRQHDPNVLS